MANIKVTMKDGTIREFIHKGRPGGSYTKTLRYEGAFVIITDEYDKDVAIPAEDIAEIESWPHEPRW